MALKRNSRKSAARKRPSSASKRTSRKRPSSARKRTSRKRPSSASKRTSRKRPSSARKRTSRKRPSTVSMVTSIAASKRTSAAAPKRLSDRHAEKTFYMTVKLISGDGKTRFDGNHDGRYLKYIEPFAEVIVKWYKQYFSHRYWKSQLSDFKISHVSGNRFKVTYIVTPAGAVNLDIMSQLIADPDEDGNDPININRVDYLVVGQVQK